MGFQADLIAGVAQLLADAGIGEWSPDTAYTGDLPAIVARAMPASPDAAIMLATYGVSDDPTQSTSVIGLQVQTRTTGADPRTTDDLADSIFDALQGLWGATLSTGVSVVIAERRSSLSLGRDDLNRWVQSDNFYVTVHRASTNRH